MFYKLVASGFPENNTFLFEQSQNFRRKMVPVVYWEEVGAKELEVRADKL